MNKFLKCQSILVPKKLIAFDYFFKTINLTCGHPKTLNACTVAFILYISNPNFFNTRHNVYSPTEMCTVTAFLSTVRAHRAKLWADFTPGMDLMSFKI